MNAIHQMATLPALLTDKVQYNVSEHIASENSYLKKKETHFYIIAFIFIFSPLLFLLDE